MHPEKVDIFHSAGWVLFSGKVTPERVMFTYGHGNATPPSVVIEKLSPGVSNVFFPPTDFFFLSLISD